MIADGFETCAAHRQREIPAQLLLSPRGTVATRSRSPADRTRTVSVPMAVPIHAVLPSIMCRLSAPPRAFSFVHRLSTLTMEYLLRSPRCMFRRVTAFRSVLLHTRHNN